MPDQSYDEAHYVPHAPLTDAEIKIRKRVNKLIAALPVSGSVIVCASHADIAPLRRLVHERRGSDIYRRTMVIAAPSVEDEALMLRTLVSLPVFRDPFVSAYRRHHRALRLAYDDARAA